mmetsp:Transcript_46907/g.75069  ORF Transcript_46907/g.75069 Transcript_46907/m.75069 type:complete len:207 (-) Transcript_46907:1097-1717(-)
MTTAKGTTVTNRNSVQTTASRATSRLSMSSQSQRRSLNQSKSLKSVHGEIAQTKTRTNRHSLSRWVFANQLKNQHPMAMPLSRHNQPLHSNQRQNQLHQNRNYRRLLLRFIPLLRHRSHIKILLSQSKASRMQSRMAKIKKKRKKERTKYSTTPSTKRKKKKQQRQRQRQMMTRRMGMLSRLRLAMMPSTYWLDHSSLMTRSQHSQ